MPRRVEGRAACSIALFVALSACSTVTPNFNSVGANPQKTDWPSEQHLINHIQCQLADAVRTAVKTDERNVGNIAPGYRATWIKDWGAKVSLVLAVNDKATLSPGVTFSKPLANAISVFSKGGNVTTQQNRTTAIGGTLSSDATRTETIGFFYSFKDLLDDKSLDTTKCQKSQGMFLSSDLKLADFIEKGIDISYQPGEIIRKPDESPYQTFTYEVKFIVTATGTYTPGWKLVQISTNQNGTLFSGSKIHTDDLTITMGKVDVANGKVEPSQALDQQHLANLIGQAVSNALQNHQPQ